MKTTTILNRAAIVACIATTGFLSTELQADQKSPAKEKGVASLTEFRTLNQNAIMKFNEDGQVRATYGSSLSLGGSPEDSARNFLTQWAGVYGTDMNELEAVGPYADGHSVQPLRYNRATGEFGMSLVNYRQTVNGIPVYGSRVMILVRHDPGFPVVNAKGDIKPIKGWTPGPIANDLPNFNAALASGDRFLGEEVELASDPSLVVFAGEEGVGVAPRLAQQFEITSGSKLDNTFQKWLLITDVSNGDVLYSENRIVNCGFAGCSGVHTLATAIPADVTGQTLSQSTIGTGADVCEPEELFAMPHVFVSGSNGQTATADKNGNWTLPSSGNVTVTTSLNGPYFTMNNVQGSEHSFSGNVANEQFLSLENNDTSEVVLAQTNAYYWTNKTRDFVLEYNPLYPTIGTETGFGINVMVSGTCNAYYDGSSSNFYPEGGGCSNTAFSPVIIHEYGHHLVGVNGSGQAEWGEGMGDSMSVIITGDPKLAKGFFTNDCNDGIRTANNTCQYTASCSTCGSAIHSCGQLISGCVYDFRTAMIAAYPDDGDETTDDGDDICNSLVIDSMIHKLGSNIDPLVYLDYLTMDDDDGDLSNGTPHFTEINAAFAAHGMDDYPEPPEPVDNDTCDTARALEDGTHSFTSLGSTNGSDSFNDSQCPDTYLGQMLNDVWFSYYACESGSMTVSTCNTIDFDSDIVVYDGTCGSLTQVACNGDGSGCDGYSSIVTMNATEGSTYLIRVGDYDGGGGSGDIIIDGPGVPCGGGGDTVSFEYPDGTPTVIDPAGGTSLTVNIVGDGSVDPAPGSGRMYIQLEDESLLQGTMNETGPNTYQAIFPALECTSLSYYFSAVGDDDTEYISPSLEAVVYSDIVIIADDNGETTPGWIVGGTATDGGWDNGLPVNCGRCDPPTDADGSGRCWLTDNSSAGDCNSDVDGGSTTLTSPTYDASDPTTEVSYIRWFSNGAGCTTAPQDDSFLVEASADGGSTWTTIETVAPTTGAWVDVTFSPSSFGLNSSNFRLRFTATDTGDGSVVEAGIDAIRLTATECNDAECLGDVNGDQDVNVADLLVVIAEWGNPFSVNDLLVVIANWGNDCN